MEEEEDDGEEEGGEEIMETEEDAVGPEDEANVPVTYPRTTRIGRIIRKRLVVPETE